MKKTTLTLYLLLLIITLSLLFIVSNPPKELKAKSVTKKYYNALIKEDYEETFELVYLYDYTEDQHPMDGTVLNMEEAKVFYMQKIAYLKEQNYTVKVFEIQNSRYEDGHTFFLEILLTVELDGERFEWAETIDVQDGKVWVIAENDPFAKYRDGKLNFDIEKELQENGI
ncbi:MAG: hypothetical protein RR642_14325 [Solibacillus sp.]